MSTLTELRHLGQQWAQRWRAPCTLALYGDMGSGKTTFVRFVLEALLNEPCEVLSPTFPIVQVYQTPLGVVWHADLYRLNSLSEVEEVGIVEAMHQHMCAIEWPQLIEPILAYVPHHVVRLSAPVASETAVHSTEIV